MSEPDYRWRLEAAYRKAGFDRASFSRALGITYATLDAWDDRKAVPHLETYARAAELVGFSLDELMHGHAAREPRAYHPASERYLTRPAVNAALTELGVTAAPQREAVANAHVTPSYLAAFATAYASASARPGMSHDAAFGHALIMAERERTMTDAAPGFARGTRPASADEFAAAGKAARAEIEAAAAPPTPPAPPTQTTKAPAKKRKR